MFIAGAQPVLLAVAHRAKSWQSSLAEKVGVYPHGK